MEIGYVLGISALFLYSFTQVDLSLTLSRASWVQDLEKSFQYIGYFNRPLSTYLFIGIILFLYFFYIRILLSLKQLSLKKVWMLIFFSTGILLFAYNAFSYDLFNYIFDAKIVTYYQQNPYEHKALDYAGEPMLSFMRWTHRVYPYGPIWLGLTIPLSYIGLQYFAITFILFKALMAFSFLGSAWFLYKITQKISPQHEKFALAFFALNPFVLIESIVSAHNDIVMIFFIMIAMYFLVKEKYVMTFVFLAVSYGIKFASPELPFFIHALMLFALAIGLFIFAKIHKKISWNTVFITAGCCMIFPIMLASLRTNFQPWYILLLLPFGSLASKNNFISSALICLSVFALFEYIPYLYLGNWDPPVPSLMFFILSMGIVVSLLCGCIVAMVTKNR